MPSKIILIFIILLSILSAEEKAHVSFCPYLGKRKIIPEVGPQTLASFFD
jgi:hypothetical protein